MIGPGGEPTSSWTRRRGDIIRRKRPEAVGIVMPPRSRCCKRAHTSEPGRCRRQEVARIARGEIRRHHEYDYLVVNDGLDAAVRDPKRSF